MSLSQVRREYSQACKEENTYLLVPGPSIYEYVRGHGRHRRGVLVAFRHPADNLICIGWSLCRVNKEKFCPHIGKNKAFKSAVPLHELLARVRQNQYVRVGYTGIMNHWDEIPFSIQKDVDRFARRAYKYFYKKVVAKTPNLEGVDLDVNLAECTVPAVKPGVAPPVIDPSQIASRSPSEIERLMQEMEDLTLKETEQRKGLVEPYTFRKDGTS
jgi:hypothetical protein